MATSPSYSSSATTSNPERIETPATDAAHRPQLRRISTNSTPANKTAALIPVAHRPTKRTTKRRTKSESSLPSPGSDIATTKTGRVKRALKGQKVHKCHCGKVYTRNEHLRRHQLSHGEPPLTCDYPGCDKSFYRNDLHDRHMKDHESTVDNHSYYLGNEPTVDQEPAIVPAQHLPASTMNPGSSSYNFDFSSEIVTTLGVQSVSNQDGLPSMNRLYSIAPSRTTHTSGHPAQDPYSDSTHWYMSNTGFMDSNNTPDNTDVSSEFSYGSTLHHSSSAPVWSRSSLEQSASARSTPGMQSLDTPWSADDSMHLLDIESIGASPLSYQTNPTWYSTAASEMPRINPGPGIGADSNLPVSLSTLTMDDTTPTPSSFVTNDAQPHAPTAWPGYLDKISQYYNPMMTLVHNSQIRNGFVPPSWTGLMTAIGLSETGDDQINAQAQSLFNTSFELFNSTIIPQDKLFRLTHMQLVWLAETFLHYRSTTPPMQPTRKFFRLIQAIQNDPEHRPTVDIAAGALEYVTTHPYSLQDSWRYWIYREGKRRLFLACYVWDLQQHLLLGRPRLVSDDDEFAMPHSDALWNATTATEWHAQLQRESSTFSSQPRTFNQLAGPKGIGFDTTNYAVMVFITLWNTMHKTSASIPLPPGLFRNPLALLSYHAYHMASRAPIKEILAVSGSQFAPTTARTNSISSEHTIRRWRHTSAANIAVRHAREVLRSTYNESSLSGTDHALTHASRNFARVRGPLHSQWSLHLAVLVCWACSEELVATTLSPSSKVSAPIFAGGGGTDPVFERDAAISDFFTSLDLAIERGIPAAEMQWAELGLRKVAGWASGKIAGTMGGLTKAACEVLARIERET